LHFKQQRDKKKRSAGRSVIYATYLNSDVRIAGGIIRNFIVGIGCSLFLHNADKK